MERSRLRGWDGRVKRMDRCGEQMAREAFGTAALDQQIVVNAAIFSFF